MEGNSKFRITRRRAAAAFLALGVTAGMLTAFGSPASADTDLGALAIKSTGSTYAGTTETGTVITGEVGKVVPAGKTAKFSVEVINLGSTTTYFVLEGGYLQGPGTVRVLSGKMDVTDLAGNGGYPTGNLRPGQKEPFTLEITNPPDASPDDITGASLELLSSDHMVGFALETAFAGVTATKGTTDHDLFVKAAGQGTIRANESGNANDYNGTSSPVIKSGKKATYTMTLRNDSAAAADLTMQMSHLDYCQGFTTTVFVGKNDVSDAVFSGTYQVNALAPKKSVVFKVTVTDNGTWSPTCVFGNLVVDVVQVTDGLGNTSQAVMDTNGQ